MENMNDDLISRQDTIKYLMTNMNWYDEDGYESDDDYKRECITELISGVPSAQPKRRPYHEEWVSALRTLPEIIRCKDCKFWETTWAYDFDANLHYCTLVDGTRRDDFYCADAERRTDE